MFERYTEKARRVIFFARYEASAFGAPYIETEHLLLGLLREDKALALRAGIGGVEEIRREIEDHSGIPRERISTSVDLPLSNESKRILAHAAEEAERADHKHIGTEHLLCGVLREAGCFAAQLLKKRGITLEAVRRDLQSSQHDVGWIGPARGFGGGVGFGGARKPTTIEFICGDKKLLGATSFGRPPRTGEYVVFGSGESAKRYRVRDVTYRYPDIPSETAAEAVDAMKNIGAIPPGGLRPLIPDCITIQLEED